MMVADIVYVQMYMKTSLGTCWQIHSFGVYTTFHLKYVLNKLLELCIMFQDQYFVEHFRQDV